jgi:multidrug resistance efflux pump
MQDPIKKAHAELAEAAIDLTRYLKLVAAGLVSNPPEVTDTSVYKTLKDAMNRVDFLARSGASVHAEDPVALVL